MRVPLHVSLPFSPTLITFTSHQALITLHSQLPSLSLSLSSLSLAISHHTKHLSLDSISFANHRRLKPRRLQQQPHGSSSAPHNSNSSNSSAVAATDARRAPPLRLHAASLAPSSAGNRSTSPWPPYSTTIAKTTEEVVEPQERRRKALLNLTRKSAENSSELPSSARFFADRPLGFEPRTCTRSSIFRLPNPTIERPKSSLYFPDRWPQYPSAANVDFPT